jgi:ubiquinone/menaquinone biosynthesis C-methylase UbiE
MPSIQHSRPDKCGAFHHPAPYDRIAKWQLRRLYARVAADVVAAGLPAGAHVLDVGTGPGRVPRAVAAARPALRVEGLDLSDEMIAYARRAAAAAGLADRVSFTVGDVADLSPSHPDESVDLIVSTLSQHHWADVPAGIRELRRVLRPAGQAWIYDIRFALRRAEIAAQALFPGYRVYRETVRTGPLSLGLIARLVVRPA